MKNQKSQQLKYTKAGPARSNSQSSLKGDASPTKKVTEADPLGVSQVASDLGKSQQSFRSSQSPNGHSPTSKLSNSMVQPGVRAYNKRPSSIISKAQLQNMHERSVIKLLGLNLEAVCSKPSHDKNKMLFICQLPSCSADNRLGCAYCQLESHADHPTQNIEIQTFCRTFDERYKEFQSQAFCIQQTPNMSGMIKQAFERLRQQLLEKLIQIEISVTEAINQHLLIEDRHTALIQRVDMIAKKNIFEMTQEELVEMLEFNNGRHLQQLQKVADHTNSLVNEKTQQVNIIWDNFFGQLELDLLNTVNDNSEIFLMDPNSKEFATLKLQKQEQRKQRIEQTNQQFKQIVDKYKEQERQEYQRKIEIENKKRVEEQQRQQEAERKLQEEIQRKVVEEADAEREKILRTFPHILYTEDCKHRQTCNTIPIFSCCNKAYPCVQCHGYKSHPPRISVPSYRYCMRCLEIYLVIYPTNQAVNCLKCAPS